MESREMNYTVLLELTAHLQRRKEAEEAIRAALEELGDEEDSVWAEA